MPASAMPVAYECEIDGMLVKQQAAGNIRPFNMAAACTELSFTDLSIDLFVTCRAKAVLEKAFPDYKVVTVPSREILLGGGNIHCITQQQPR